MNPFVSPDDTFENHTFTRLAFEGEPVRGREFHECHFIHCSLREAVFQKCRFNDCTFQDCDLSLVNLEGCTFRNTQFKTCKLIGVNWAIAKWSTVPIAYVRHAGAAYIYTMMGQVGAATDVQELLNWAAYHQQRADAIAREYRKRPNIRYRRG